MVYLSAYLDSKGIKVDLELFSGEGDGTPLQYTCLENPIDGGAWWAAVHGVPKSRTRLSDFTFTLHFHALEKEMATHSSVLAWRIPGTGEPGKMLSMGLHRVGHNWSDLAAAAAAELFSEKGNIYHLGGIRIALSISTSEPCLCLLGISGPDSQWGLFSLFLVVNRAYFTSLIKKLSFEIWYWRS